MHRILQRLIDRAGGPEHLDRDELIALVDDSLENLDIDRVRSERATQLMAEEIEEYYSRQQAALREKTRLGDLLENAVNCMQHGLAIIDERGHLVLANPRLKAMYGIEDGDSGQNWAAGLVSHALDERRQGLIGADSVLGTIVETGGRSIEVTNTVTPAGWTVSVHKDVTELRRAEDRLRQVAYSDPLTGLANRQYFDSSCRQIVGTPPSIGGGLLLVNVDRFREVNDVLGQENGDIVLTAIAAMLRGAVPAGNLLARLTADEFGILVDGVEACEIEALALRVHEVLTRTLQLGVVEVPIDVSIGLARYPADAGTYPELLKLATLALAGAKGQGGRRVAAASRDHLEAADRRSTISTFLRKAILNGNGLSLAYQPQLDTTTGGVKAFEALCRLRHPVLGEVSPAEFIAIAEADNLIRDLGAWVLDAALLQMRQWIDSGAQTLPVAVNLSVAQIRFGDVVEDVRQALSRYRVPPRLLCIELTESVIADGANGVVHQTLTRLAELGVTLSLDDFGATYSSLGYLASLPFHEVKVDRMFVREVDKSDRAASLLAGIIGLVRGLGMDVVGEGAETDAEVNVLRRLGCRVIQGYAVGRPVDREAATRMLRQRDIKA